MTRDPRHDPRPGYVVRSAFGDTYTVTAREGDDVRYVCDDVPAMVPIDVWRLSAEADDVVHVAPDAPTGPARLRVPPCG